MKDYKIYSHGNIRGDKIKYGDGVGCCIWYPFGDDEESGICFDFGEDDIDNIIKVLQELKQAEPDIYIEENK